MRILLATDGSEASEAAVNGLLLRPWPENSSVRVLSVVLWIYPAIPEGALLADFQQAVQQLVSEAEALVRRVAESLERSGLRAEGTVRRGDPGREIVTEAEEFWADLIVVGSRGRTGLERWLLGSVAEYVVRHAPCSVEMVRPRGANRASTEAAS
jgi:nucleotide-binding universal stress UspA family protein